MSARQAPQIEAMIEALSRHGVRWVLGGSFAAKLHGVELQPGDLDVVPALDEANLERLFGLLAEIEAKPLALGHWETDERGERRWVQDDSSPEAIAAWTPSVDDPASYDHLFASRLGAFDVVPEILGRFDELDARAVTMTVGEREVRVAHVDDQLATLTVPRRDKDVTRVAALRAIQREQAGRAAP